jgi:hypothetical protein
VPYKPIPPESEIDALADQLRASWRNGEPFQPWLRRHAHMLHDLVRQRWPWEGLAVVLNRVGIGYRTGRPITGEVVRVQVAKERTGKKLLGNQRADETITRGLPDSGHEKPAGFSAQEPTTPAAVAQMLYPIETPAEVQVASVGQKVPMFRPASLKPYEPPRALTPDELKEREANRVRMFGQ